MSEPLDLAQYRRWSRLDLQLAAEPPNDLGNARRLLARFGERLRYVPSAGWYVLEHGHWQPNRLAARQAAQEAAAAVIGEAEALAALGRHPEAAALARWGIKSGRRYWALLRAAAPLSLAAQRRQAA